MIYADYGNGKRVRYGNIVSARRAAYQWCKNHKDDFVTFFKSPTSYRPISSMVWWKNTPRPTYFGLWGCDIRPGYETRGVSGDIGTILSTGKLKSYR